MPMYEFVCIECGRKREKLFTIKQFNNLSFHCECGGEMVNKITGNGFRLKGRGWPSKSIKEGTTFL